MITFTVHGLAKPQGSKNAFIHPHTKRLIVTESAGKPLKTWRNCVALEASAAMNGRPPYEAGVPVVVTVVFFLPRPEAHFGTGKNAGVLKESAPRFPTKQPDGDKLVRAVFDSLTGRVYHDDSQVVDHHAKKRFTDSEPYAVIKVEILK